jgi:hypothetical protein
MTRGHRPGSFDSIHMFTHAAEEMFLKRHRQICKSMVNTFLLTRLALRHYAIACALLPAMLVVAAAVSFSIPVAIFMPLFLRPCIMLGMMFV